MATRDGDGKTRGMNSKGKTVTFDGSLKPAGKPTEAITAKGQKATNLGKSKKENRFASNAKTPVKKAGSGFAGSGGTLSSGFKNITKGDVVSAAGAVALAQQQLGKVGAWVAKQEIKDAFSSLRNAANKNEKGPFKNKPSFTGESKETTRINQTKTVQVSNKSKEKIKKK